jgi:hypothetical protein
MIIAETVVTRNIIVADSIRIDARGLLRIQGTDGEKEGAEAGLQDITALIVLLRPISSIPRSFGTT